MSNKQLSNHIGYDSISELLDCRTIEAYHDSVFSSGEGPHTYDCAMREARAEGKSEEEAEKYAAEAEQAEIDEVLKKYMNELESVFEQMCSDHGLEVTKHTSKKKGIYFTLTPKKSWRDAAECIRDTINGVGSFYFSSLKEFLASGPYTAREAVLTHLHWMKRRPDVYGDRPYKDRMR